MKYVPLLALLVLLLCPARAEDELSALGREYRELRQVKGWFQGGDGWIEAVDSWKGRKHEVMARLGELLGDGQHTRSQVEAVMGAPDIVAGPGSLEWNRLRCPHSEAALIYQWRGGHDFLYFEVREGRVTGSDWWMAYE